MAIYNYNVKVKVIIRDTETDAKREEIFTRPLITMHQEGTSFYFELIDVAVQELIEEIEDSILDVEELVSFKVEVNAHANKRN